MRRLLLALSLLAVAGCGGGQEQPTTIDGLAEKIDCQPVEHASTDDRQMFVEDQAECRQYGDTLHLYAFTNNEARDNWLNVARTFGGRYVVLDRMIVHGDEAKTADQVKKAAGGTIKV